MRGLVIEGYAIVSADGMIADRNGHMPDGLKHEPDTRPFVEGMQRELIAVGDRLDESPLPAPAPEPWTWYTAPLQHLNIAGVHQLGADFLQLSVGGEFRLQLLLGLAQ